jgi:hypothetical protein
VPSGCRTQLARQGAAPEFRREAIEGLKAAVEGAVHSPRHRARPDGPGISSRGPKGRVVHVRVTGRGAAVVAVACPSPWPRTRAAGAPARPGSPGRGATVSLSPARQLVGGIPRTRPRIAPGFRRKATRASVQARWEAGGPAECQPWGGSGVRQTPLCCNPSRKDPDERKQRSDNSGSRILLHTVGILASARSPHRRAATSCRASLLCCTVERVVQVAPFNGLTINGY